VLRVRNLQVTGLAPVDLDLDAGDCIALSGPSGSGKTLILRSLADLDPSEGEVTLDGEARDSIAAPLWRRRVAYLAAEPGWWADVIGAHFAAHDLEAARELAAALGLSEKFFDAPVAQVSTGERQRLALVRLLLLAPRVMLLDEPTAALDEAAAARVEAVLTERLAAGVAIILVTHDDAQAARLASRRLRIADGRLEDAA